MSGGIGVTIAVAGSSGCKLAQTCSVPPAQVAIAVAPLHQRDVHEHADRRRAVRECLPPHLAENGRAE